MNKFLIMVIVPEIEMNYEIYIPNNKKVGTIKKYVYRSIVELSNGSLEKKEEEMKLIDRNTGREYQNDIYIKDTNIRNGSKVILL